jgi:hypothetical protein
VPPQVAEAHHRPQNAPTHHVQDVRQPVPNLAEVESFIPPNTHDKVSQGNASSKIIKQSVGGEHEPAGYSRPQGRVPGTGAETRDGE